MTLEVDGLEEENLFTHSEDFATGMGMERPGAATFVVSLDNTGDYDDIQEAINALPTSGGEIYIKEGTYYIDKTIQVPTECSLSGTGRGTIIRPTVNTVSPMMEVKGDFRLTNIRLYGYDKSFNLDDVAILNQTAGSDSMGRIEGCYFEGFESATVISVTSTTAQIRITNCYFRDIDGDAINTEGYYNIFIGNRFESCVFGKDFILGNSSNNCIVLGNALLQGVTDNGAANVVANNS